MASAGGGSNASAADWKGLLNWSLKYQDGTADPSMSQQLDEDKKRFLEKVMEGTFKDETKQMKELLAELKESVHDNGKIERIQDLWEEMMDLVENLDYAVAFCQIDGLPILFQYLEEETDEDHCLPALSVLSVLTQNNPQVQDEVLALNPVPRLCHFVLRENGSDKLMAKALGALSALIRGHVEAEDIFLANHGHEILTAALAKEDSRVRQKVLFLLQALIGADHATKERGELLLPLLPLVAHSLVDEDFSIRHIAAVVVSELSNLLGASAIKEGASGEELQKAMAIRRGVINALTGVDADEAADETRFWDTLESGGRFLRDGETAEEEAGVIAEAGEGEVQQLPGHEQEEAAAAAAPPLLLAPPQLSGASQAP